ncbi:MAG: S8 family serine peptidase [Alphaproteobacteria bacterium]|nr:S8 family serine peptidase [Alphaproteobacteria bacterium]
MNLLLFALSPAALAGENTALVGITEDGSAPVHAAAGALGGEPGRCFHSAGVCVLSFPDAPPLDALRALPGVRYAEQDRVMEPAFGAPEPAELPVRPPSDAQGTPECPDLWELALLEAEDLPVDGTNAPVVAIQDTGFLLSHVELQGRISGQYDYGDGDSTPEVCWSSGIPAHGSFISGMIAADPDNGVIRAGLAPNGHLNLQKIADSSGALYYSYAISAMADLAEGDLGVRVLNYSIASSSPTQSFGDAVAGLADADILVVAAAGNCSTANCWDADNDQHPLYPASYDYAHVLSVAGSTRDDGYNTYSHYGRSSVDLAAPGVDLCSLGAYGDADSYTAAGTSYATPLVAAAAALVWEAHPGLSAEEVSRILRASVVEVPAWAARVRSGGRLDVQAALRTALPRLVEPQTLSFDREGSLALQLSDPAAEGQATLLLFHGEGLEVSAPEGWSLRRFGPGDTLELPDAGSWTSDVERGSVITGTLPEHSADALVLGLRGLEAGAHAVKLRVALSSEGADYLNAPFQDGAADPTGFLAYSLDVIVTEPWTEPEDTDPPDDSAAPDDSAPTDDSDPSVDSELPDTGEAPADGCACAGAPASPSWGWALLLMALIVGRRR